MHHFFSSVPCLSARLAQAIAVVGIAAAVGLSSAPSHAQDAPDGEAQEESKDAAASDAAKAKKGAKGKTKTDGDDDAPTNPNLAPGGVVTGGSSFPLSVNITMSSSLGIGTFSPGYTNNPLIGTDLSISPVFKVPTFGLYNKPVIISGRVGVGVSNWLPANTNIDNYTAVPRLTDVNTQLVLPAFFVESFTGTAFTPIIQLRLPLSLASWQANVMFSTAVAVLAGWNYGTDFGTFTVQYVPSGRYNQHHTAGPTRKCSDYIEGGRNTDPWGSPSANLGDIPESVICRDEEKLPDGRAIVPGRQVMATVANSGTLAYTTPGGAHNFSLSYTHILAFQRPLTDRPDLSNLNASNQNFIEFQSGSLSYTYTVPIDVRLFITAGMSTFGPMMDPKGYPRFPFFDFYTPQQNFTTGFLSATVSF